MKAQRPSHHEARAVAPAHKFGETGDTWGNLRADEARVELDERFTFEDDPARRLFQVTRLFPDPLDPKRRIAFYEAVERDPWPQATA